MLIIFLLSIYNFNTDATPNKFLKCNQDDECVSIGDGCCGCTGGGMDTAINKMDTTEKSYIQEFNQYREKKFGCSRAFCAKVMSHHWTCNAKPKCVNGKCQLLKSL
ncbi:MAG: hypothetical protein AABX33_07180 [Nanoarchaeota archaeon]